MLFNSYVFIFAFLPIAIIGYYLLGKLQNGAWAKAFLVGMSLWFYAYFKIEYLPIIVSSICLNYLCSRKIQETIEQDKKKSLLVLGIVFNIALIFVFKYLDFTISNLNALFRFNLPLQKILMPLGISFFTFQQIGYLVDVYNEETGKHNFLEYSLFVTFFPQLIAGPIVSMEEMLPQIQDENKRRFCSENFSEGIYYFVFGLAKKVLLADTLGKAVDLAFHNVNQLNGPEVVLIAITYTLQLYFDFSGYCDMAFGIAKFFNMTLPINFNSPLKACSILEYWDKWHMTLGRFLEKYVFMPIAFSGVGMKVNKAQKGRGVKKPQLWTVISLLLTFLISGIWHGANWTFILWGCMHGTVRAWYQLHKKKWNKLPRFFRWGVNFTFVVLTMLLFRSDSISDFGHMIMQLGNGWSQGIKLEILQCFDVVELTYLEEHIRILNDMSGALSIVNTMIVLALAAFIALKVRNLHEIQWKRTRAMAVVTAIVFGWCVVSLSNMATFLYFNF